MSFAVLAVVALVGLLGPLLSMRRSWHLPVVLGPLLAGLALGPSGFGRLDASDPTFTFLADVGFVLIMFVAGARVPVRDPSMRTALRIGVGRAAGVALPSVVLGIGLAKVFGTGHAALYAVLLASSSAALILPIVESLGLNGKAVLQMLPQVAVADTACIIALPLAIDPAHAMRAALGALEVLGCAAALFLLLRHWERTGRRRRLHRISEEHKFALELRISLSMVFALAALAVRSHVSIMLAGFSFGLAVAGVGAPRRLAKQLFAVTEGFLGPLFFVWLGAELDLRQLGAHPWLILLGIALGLGAVLVHAAMGLTRQPLSIGVLTSAQLGVPIAAATIGSQLHVLAPGEPAALILGALVTIAAAVLAGGAAARRQDAP